MLKKIYNDSLTQQEMLLISFYRVSNGSIQKVPYEELVLQLWRDFPVTFSLRNHPEHPDASDVHKKLYNGSLKTDGLVISLGNKVFRLTDKGIARAKDIIASLEGAESSSQEQSRLSRSEENFIKHAHSSRPFATWRAGQNDKLVDYDARVFFQFSTGTPIDERKRKVMFAKSSIQKAINIRVDGADDLGQLGDFLIDKFDGLLKEV